MVGYPDSSNLDTSYISSVASTLARTTGGSLLTKSKAAAEYSGASF
jgi:hypothetical protein